MSTKTIVIAAIVALFALAALSLAGYAAWELYKRHVAPRGMTPPPVTAPATTETTDTTASAVATETAAVEIVETTTATDTTASVVDTATATATTDTAAPTTTTQAPPPTATKPPLKTTKKREKPAVKPPVEPTPKAQPEPEPEPEVNEGDLVAPGPGVVDAKIIVQQPLRLSFKDRVKRTRGTATVSLVVGINGVPENLEILQSSGDDAIDAAALKAAGASRFTPATKNGVKVRVRTVLQFSNEKQNSEQ